MQRQKIVRRSRQLHPFFEVASCDIRGTKVQGTKYRRGLHLSGDAYEYQFSRGSVEIAESTYGCDEEIAHQPERRILEERLSLLLPPETIDLLYLIAVAGVSQADIARERGVARSTVKRQYDAAIAITRSDAIVSRLVSSSAEDERTA